MRFLFISFISTILWITANSGTIETNGAPNDDNDAPTINEQLLSLTNCTRNLCKHELYKDRCEDMIHFLDETRDNIKQQLEKEGSLKNLDPILQHTCNSIRSRDVVYNLTIDLIKHCSKQEVLSTPEEILIAKEKLKEKACYVDMRIAVLLDYEDKCKPEKAERSRECSRIDHILKTPVVDAFLGSPKVCTSLAERNDCQIKVFREYCDATLSEQWELFFDALDNYHGCNFRQNSTSTENSSVV